MAGYAPHTVRITDFILGALICMATYEDNSSAYGCRAKLAPRSISSRVTAGYRPSRSAPQRAVNTAMSIFGGVAIALALPGCGVVDAGGLSPSPRSSAAGDGEASQALTALPVKEWANHIGYSRGQFGQSWADIDRNGCDQRNDVLSRDLSDKVFRPGTHSCVVMSGTLTDPYSGEVISFVRGKSSSTIVQIDHVVSLSDAWQTGAQDLDERERERLANDPLNLLAVSGRRNESKGDSDAATWLPPAQSYRCKYVATQIAVKTRYHLWVTPTESKAMAVVLNKCPLEPLPY